MTKKQFMQGYLEASARILLKEQQAEGKHIPEMLAAEVAELEAKRREVLAAIETAPEASMRMVLEALYINGLTIDQAAYAVGYSTRNVIRVRNKALDAMKFSAGVE